MTKAIEIVCGYRGTGSIPPPDVAPSSRVRTEFSATLFTGDARDWIAYLSRGAQSRTELGLSGTVVFGGGGVIVEADNPESTWFCSMLTAGIARLGELARGKPNVHLELSSLASRNAHAGPYKVRLSRSVPTVATLEVDAWQEPSQSTLVINRGLMLALREALNACDLTAEQALGLLWPVVSQFIVHLAFPGNPRNRYAAKIDVVARFAYVAVNVLYEVDHAGALLGTLLGETLERVLATTTGRDRKQIRERDEYLRFLRSISFVLRARPFDEYEGELKISAREYLDGKYTRLSLAGAMPDMEAWRSPMLLDETSTNPKVKAPKVGRYGVADQPDLEAWDCVVKPLRELGFVLLRQVGVGDFGRVYEARNLGNPRLPARVALKVDKFFGKKKHAILAAELAMRVGQDLAPATQLIRLYDTGKVHRKRFTYHVLQLVDGETVDGLVGAVECEHSSLAGPPRGRRSILDLRRELAARIGLASALPKPMPSRGVAFRFGLSPAMLLDLLTEMLTCLEEVHLLGYAMNDLKNDNMMISRRGQLKGIDLDSFSPITSPRDKFTDFLFLAASLVLVTLRAPAPHVRHIVDNWRELQDDEGRLREALTSAWPDAVVTSLSEGRLPQEALIDVLVRLIVRSKRLTYALEPATFSRDIGDLVAVKRRLLQEDLVID